MMNVEFNKEELSLIQMLLKKEEVMTRIEVHHARWSFDYRDYLKQREKMIGSLLERIKPLLPEEKAA
jgi:hypothetical protein